jgi:hypothetical protein
MTSKHPRPKDRSRSATDGRAVSRSIPLGTKTSSVIGIGTLVSRPHDPDVRSPNEGAVSLAQESSHPATRRLLPSVAALGPKSGRAAPSRKTGVGVDEAALPGAIEAERNHVDVSPTNRETRSQTMAAGYDRTSV